MKDREEMKRYTIDPDRLDVDWQAQQVHIQERIRESKAGCDRGHRTYRWLALTTLILLAVFGGFYLNVPVQVVQTEDNILISDEAFMESLEDYDYQLPTSLVVLNEIEDGENESYKVIYEIMNP